MSEQEEHFLSSTPVSVTLQSLQRQVDQLKRIINCSDNKNSTTAVSTTTDEKELRHEIEELRTANAKAEYRIKMLLRTLEEKDKQQQ